MQEIRPLLHEILNALAICRGMNEAIEMSLNGDFPMSDEKKKEKIVKSIAAMDRIEVACKDIRHLVVKD